MQEYLKDRKLNRVRSRLQYEARVVRDFKYKVDHFIVLNDVIIFSSGSKLIALRSQFCVLIHSDNSIITNMDKLSDNTFLFSTLGGSKPGCLHKCSLSNDKLHIIKSCILKKGSIYAFGYRKFTTIFSEKSIFIYSLQLKYKRRIPINSDVLHCSNYNNGMILSCRNGQLLYFDLSTFKLTNIFKCDSAPSLLCSNNTIYACTNTILYTFTNFNQINTYETPLDAMFISSDHLIETNPASTIIKSLHTMEITHIFDVHCNQFISATDGHIFNDAYCMW